MLSKLIENLDLDPRDGIEPDWIRRDDPGVIEKLWHLDIPPRWVWAFVVVAIITSWALIALSIAPGIYRVAG